MIETINKLNRISRQMLQEMGREPTPEELAERMLMPEDKIRKVLKIAKGYLHGKRRSATMKIRIWGFHRGYHPRAAAGFCDHREPARGNA